MHTTTDELALERLLARTAFHPTWGFAYVVCPICGSDGLLTQMREADHTHRPWTVCAGCSTRLGWSTDIHADICRQLRACGCDVREAA